MIESHLAYYKYAIFSMNVLKNEICIPFPKHLALHQSNIYFVEEHVRDVVLEL